MITELSTVFVRRIITNNIEIHLGLLMQTEKLLLVYINYRLNSNLILLHIRDPYKTLKKPNYFSIMIGAWRGHGAI